VTSEPQSPRARRLTAAPILPSVVGVALLVWWAIGSVRAWWMLVAGAIAAIIGVAVAARARREPPTEGGR
jgi:hypothetical protein